MKVLNLYAGIGGNRKLWEDVEVTAVENVQAIADIYKDFFPEDEVIIAVGSSRVDLQACKLEYSIVSPK